MIANPMTRSSYALLSGPALLIYAAVIIFPIFYSFALSFTTWSGAGWPRFVGLANYATMAADPAFWHGLRNNAFIVAVSVFGQLPLGFVLAYVLHRRIVRGRAFFEAMIFFPVMVSAIVVALLFSTVFAPSGLFASLVRLVSGNARYAFTLGNSRDLAIIPILFVLLWMYTGMYMVIYLANLQKIPQSIIDAALVDGASEWQIMVRVVMPGMINVFTTTAIFAIAGSLKSFDLIWVMTGGGPSNYTEVIAITMFKNTFTYYKYGYGSAVSMVIVVLSVGLILLLQAVVRRLFARYL